MEKIDFNFELFKALIGSLIKNDVTDVHITPGAPPNIRQAKKLKELRIPAEDDDGNKIMANINPITPVSSRQFVVDLIKFSQGNNETRANELISLMDKQEVDTTLSIAGISRFRVHISLQRQSLSCSIRVVPSQIPNIQGFPSEIRQFANYHNGLIIISGKTSSGKSTTLATLIEDMNNNAEDSRKIITLEDPIEYLFRHNHSLIIQREIGTDTKNYKTGLLSALREDPDVVVIGELRDVDSFEIALNAAESGCLVLTTMHSATAKEALERLVSMFPNDKQNQIKSQLATVLRGVICQQLIPCADENFDSPLVAAFEIMTSNTAIQNAISKGDFKNISNIIETNKKSNMRTMKDSLTKLKDHGLISPDSYLERSNLITD